MSREALLRSQIISIHAPKGGATKLGEHYTPDFYNFNPRSQGGSDSIQLFHNQDITYFNPRSQGGSDTNIVKIEC